MKFIGILLPKCKRNILKKVMYCNVECYGFAFVITYQNKNYRKIFLKHNVKEIVLLDNAEYLGNEFKIIDGADVYFGMLPNVVRKLCKSNSDITKIIVVDKELSKQGAKLVKEFTGFSNNVSIVTENNIQAKLLTENIMNEMGAFVEIISPNQEIKSGIIVEISPCKNKKSNECIEFNLKNEKAICDFDMDFKVKPPLGIKNIVFKQCVLLTN